MTDELESQRRALASEIEQLRVQRDELKADGKPSDDDAELEAVKAERERVRTERQRISDATDQREADRGRGARVHESEYGVDHAVAAALERQRIADHTQDQDEHLASIDGSIADTVKALEDLGRQFATAAAQRVKELAVAEALAKALKDQQEGGLTSKRLYISVVAIVTPIVVTLLLVIFKG